MSGYGLKCPGCEREFNVRLGVGNSKPLRFYLPCPHCKLPIRGRQYGHDPESHRTEFDAEQVPADYSLDAEFITIDPNVPSKYAGAERGELGTFTTMTLVQLTGDNAEALFKVLPRGRYAVTELWPKARRIYEYYLAQDWKHFDKVGQGAFPDWPAARTAHERATAAHQVIGIVTAMITDDEDQSTARYLARFHRKHLSALRSRTYVESLREDVSSGLIGALQRSVFDIIERYIAESESWHIGVLPRVMPEEKRPMLDDLTLHRDEFDVLRDLYQQGFEVVCKTLRYPVGAQNALKRGDPNDFGADVPVDASVKANPKTLKKFDKELVNANKLAYVRQVPGWEGFTAMLNNKTRNAIGHATARHDLRTGRIVSDKDPAGVQYLDLVGDVFGMFDALGATMQVLRAVQVAGSPDFDVARQAG